MQQLYFTGVCYLFPNKECVIPKGSSASAKLLDIDQSMHPQPYQYYRTAASAPFRTPYLSNVFGQTGLSKQCRPRPDAAFLLCLPLVPIPDVQHEIYLQYACVQ